jgi:hypothetical protein
MSEPDSPPEKQYYFLLGVIAWAVAAYLFYNGWNSSHPGSFYLFSLILFIVGIKLFSNAKKADQEHAENRGHQVQAQSSEITYAKGEVYLGEADAVARAELALEDLRKGTEAKALLTQQTLFHNQDSVAKDATKLGRPVEVHRDIVREEELSRIRLQEHEEKARVDLQVRWQEIVQDLDAADLLEISEQQLLKKLRGNLNELYRERYQIEEGDDPPVVREKILARYDKDAGYLERLIDARQAGHFLQEDKEEVRRLAEGTPDSGADYPAAIDSDDQ